MQIAKHATEIASVPKKHAAGAQFRTAPLVFLGMGVGIVLAFFIARGDWLIMAAAVAVVPLAALLVRYPFSGIFLWLVLMPFVSVMPESQLVFWAVYRILPPALVLLTLLFRAIGVRPHTPLKIGPAELAMGLLLMYGSIAILLDQNNLSLTLIRFGDRMLIPFCLYWLMRVLAPRKREFFYLQWIALFIILSQSFIGFLSWYAPHVLPEAWQHLQGARTTGSLKDPDLYATMLAFSAVILIHAAANRKPDLIRLIFLLASGLSAVFVFLSLERAAWLAALFVIIGLVILYPRLILRSLAVGAVAVVLLGGGVLATHFSLTLSRFTESDPVYDRIVVFDAMTQMIRLKPLLGWGYDTLDQNIQPFYRRVGEASITKHIVTSHNTYLTVLAELGVVGFILYMFPVAWWFVLSMKVWRRMPARGLWSRPLLGVLWLAMLFNFTVSNSIDMRWFEIGLALWWLTLGFIANLVYPYVKVHGVQPPILIALEENHGS